MNTNIYNPYVRQELELYHHGIAGQRWGKRNGPPYPIAASAHSASEKKAGWRKSLSGNVEGRSSKRTKSAKAKTNNKSIGKAIKRKFDSITPEQKAYAKKVAATALIAVGTVAVTALAGYGAAKGVQAGVKGIKAGVKAIKAANYARIGRNYYKQMKRLHTDQWMVGDALKRMNKGTYNPSKTYEEIANYAFNDLQKARGDFKYARDAFFKSRGIRTS